jgi:hypothetical protein
LIYPLATAVDVERVFSLGCITLSYLRSRLNVQTVRALLCVGDWLKAGLIKDKEMLAWLRRLKDTFEEECEDDVAEGWDYIDM